MKRKHTIILLIIVALLAIGAYVYHAHAPQKPVHVSVPVTLSETTEAYSVNITYPTFDESLKGAKEANAAIKANLDNSLSQFKKEATDSMNAPIDLPPSIISTVTGSPSVEHETDRYISMFFGAEWYQRGAAHPYHTINTYIFDKKLGRLVDITDLFKPTTDYLKFISQYSHTDLVQQANTGDNGFSYDETMLNSGTEATYDNFHLVLPIKDGLVVYFTEYQVAPYAAGPQQVVIPYDKLKNYINPNGVLGMYLK